MPEGVEREASTFASVHAFGCCFFSVDFSMWPLRVGAGNTHSPSAAARRISSNGRRPRRERDRASRVLGLAKRDVAELVPNVFPPQAETLFRPDSAVD